MQHTYWTVIRAPGCYTGHGLVVISWTSICIEVSGRIKADSAAELSPHAESAFSNTYGPC